MHDIDWLNKGTAYWKRDGNIFTVVPAFPYFMGMLQPERNIEHGYDASAMDDLLEELYHSFRYDPDLVWYKSVKRLGTADKEEMNYMVDSLEDYDKEYVVTLFTLPFETDDIETRIMSLRNMDFIDHCGKGMHEGRLCSMPYDACAGWGIKYGEWDRRLIDNSLSKIYGKVMDKHVVHVLKNLDLYPLFDERRFQVLLPEAVELIKETPKNKKVGNKMGWYEKDLDVSLKPILDLMGFSKTIQFFRHGDTYKIIRKNLIKDMLSLPRPGYYRS